MFDYIGWRGDLDFSQSPFNPVDNIIFSQLAYLPMDEIVPGPGGRGNVSVADVAELYAEKQRMGFVAPADDIMVKDAISVIGAIGSAPRYKNCKLFGYVSSTDKFREKQ